MPLAVTAAASANVARRDPTTVALESIGRTTDKAIDKLNLDRDGFISQAELEPLKAQLDRATARMDGGGDGSVDLKNPDRNAVKKSILKARKGMTESGRVAMLLAQGASTFEDAPGDKVSVAALKKATRDQTKQLVTLLKSDAGGLEGALGKMMAIMIMPNRLLRSVIEL